MYKSISFVNKNTKLLNKSLVNLIQQYINRITHDDQGGFTKTMQG